MNIEKLINDIIPPRDYHHRNGFNNIPIIDKLSVSEKKLLENELISKIHCQNVNDIDTLILETLAHLKSNQSLPLFYDLLSNNKYDEVKLEIATFIYEINKDSNMVDIAIKCFNEIANRKDAYYVYAISNALGFLAKFNNEKTKRLLIEYSTHPEYLISYNAKKALSN